MKQTSIQTTISAFLAIAIFFTANGVSAELGKTRLGSSSALAVQTLNISLDNHGVRISWDVRNSSDVSAFEIQRAVLRNGNIGNAAWETIKSYPVIDGTIIESSFEYYDLDAPKGSPVILYRIKQVSETNDILFSTSVKINLVGTSQIRIRSAFPNPVSANASTTVEYSVGKPQFVNVSVYDVTGKELASLSDGFHNQGEFSINFSTEGLTPGTYFIRLNAEMSSSVQRIIISR